MLNGNISCIWNDFWRISHKRWWKNNKTQTDEKQHERKTNQPTDPRIDRRWCRKSEWASRQEMLCVCVCNGYSICGECTESRIKMMKIFIIRRYYFVAPLQHLVFTDFFQYFRFLCHCRHRCRRRRRHCHTSINNAIIMAHIKEYSEIFMRQTQ